MMIEGGKMVEVVEPVQRSVNSASLARAKVLAGLRTGDNLFRWITFTAAITDRKSVV